MDVAAIQRVLSARGFGSGPIDGKKGKKTTEAIKAFEVANGLGIDRKVRPPTSAPLFPELVPTRIDDLPTFPPAAIDPEVRPPATRWPRQRDCMTFLRPKPFRERLPPQRRHQVGDGSRTHRPAPRIRGRCNPRSCSASPRSAPS